MAGSARSDCPYPGLRPFREQEADLFFGREEQVEDMVARLESRSFLAVVGTSGCGKSSLVRAGLIPALREGLLSGAGSHWRTLVMRPGGDPYARLTGALIESVGPVGGADATDAAFLESRIRRGPSGLLDVLAEDRFADDSDCLLLVDQFEEIFRYRKESRQADDADAFVNLLLACAKPSRAAQPRVRKIHVVITMRSDFIGDCAVFSGLPEAINDSQFLTPRLTRRQYKDAIVEPARTEEGVKSCNRVKRAQNGVRSCIDPCRRYCLLRARPHRFEFARVFYRLTSRGDGRAAIALNKEDLDLQGRVTQADRPVLKYPGVA